MNIHIINGTKYFNFNNEGDVEVIRIKNAKDLKNIKIIRNDKKEVIDSNELLNKYTKIRPDALIYFSDVNIRDLNDVIITVSRKQEMDSNDTVPYSVCRQNITDFFANSLSKNMEYCGVNVTKETLPEGVDMNQIMACDGINSFDTVAFYLDDTLDDILSFIKTKVYDNILYTLFMDHLKYKVDKNNGGKLFLDAMKTRNTVDGYCKTLKDMLTYNNFIFDLRTGFNIYCLDIDLSEDNNSYLSVHNREVLEYVLCKNILDGPESLVILYDKDIDLTQIKKEFILVSDINENLYVVIYESYGHYHIPVENIESEENIELLAKSINYKENSSITEAYNHMKFNRDKYK